MSAKLKLSSKLPGDAEVNGLDSLAQWFEDNPDELQVAVVYLDCPKVTIDNDAKSHVPTVRVRRVEPIGTVDQVPQSVRDVVADCEADRTGRTAIPFGVVDAGEYAHSDPLPDDES